jgi:hypothetical protein
MKWFFLKKHKSVIPDEIKSFRKIKKNTVVPLLLFSSMEKLNSTCSYAFPRGNSELHDS